MEREVLQSSTVMTARAARRRRGFTLVELVLVVAIIGILAVIALVGYRRYMLHAKISEARSVIGAIKIAQEDYRAERGTYADLGPDFCPALGGVGEKKVGWDPECAGGGSAADNKWHTLPVHIAGAVQFKYATVASNAAFAAPAAASWVTWTAAATTSRPWYVVMAKCDLDGAGGNNTELVASSFDNSIFSRNDGE